LRQHAIEASIIAETLQPQHATIFQERLPKELAKAGVTDMAGANRYLKQRYRRAHNSEFAVRAAEPDKPINPYDGSTMSVKCLVLDALDGGVLPMEGSGGHVLIRRGVWLGGGSFGTVCSDPGLSSLWAMSHQCPAKIDKRQFHGSV
jgi:hypothetical protein